MQAENGGNMKRFFYLNYKNIALCLCFAFVFTGMTGIFDLFIKNENVENQTTEGFGTDKIEFVFDTEDKIDFSFLDKLKKESFAIVLRQSNYEPIYALVYTNNFFKTDEENCFSLDNLPDDENYYICGEKAGDLFSLNPFIFHDVKFSEAGMYTSSKANSIGLEYMIFLCKKNAEYIGKMNFILIGDKKSIDKVFEAICEYDENIKIYKKDFRETRVGDRERIGNEGLATVCICLMFVTLSLILIIYWWNLQFDEYRKACELLGMKKCFKEIFKSFVIALSIGFAISFFFHIKVSFFIHLSVFGAVGFLSFLIVYVCGFRSIKEDSDGKSV